MRRLKIFLVAGALAIAGLVGTAAPANAACSEDLEPACDAVCWVLYKAKVPCWY